MRANDPVQIKERERQEKLFDKQLRADLAEVLKTPAGRRLVWAYLGFCGIHREVFNTNALQMAFNDGRRSVGLKIEADIVSTNPAALLEMMKERFSQEEEKDG